MHEKFILQKSEEIKEKLIQIRRELHAHPEQSLREFKTSRMISKRLKELKIDVKTFENTTGVVGILRGKRGNGKTILLRADIDCLKIQEENDIEYKSQVDGLMHACGHDAHTAWLLGAAEILSELRNEFSGNIKFLFQPGEEGYGGADIMIHHGILLDPKVDAIIGAHVWPTIDSGKIGVKYGPMMAASDTFKLTIHGRGGHGGQPNKCIDPIAAACEIYIGFQTIISRKLDPTEPAVITVGKFNAGSAHNIIPEDVYMEGTIRTLTYETRCKIPEMMDLVVKGITEANDATYELNILPFHAPVINDAEVTSTIEETIKDIFGKTSIVKVHNPTMIGEDFSSYQEKVPGSFIWIGINNPEKGTNKPLHSPDFNLDEEVISKTAALFASTAIKFLKESSEN